MRYLLIGITLLGAGCATRTHNPGGLGGNARADLSVGKLRCEGRIEPLGIDTPRPQLSWELQAEKRGSAQVAYEIQVASSEAGLAAGHPDLWGSGRVASGATFGVQYGGAPLVSDERVFWRVRCWGRDAAVSDWSSGGMWTMGVIRGRDWEASWIADPGVACADGNGTLLLRREFFARAQPVRAIANVCGLGEYELTANGRRAGDALFSPGWTDSSRTCLYDTLDITPLLRAGRNAVGVTLAGGMFDVQPVRYVKFTSPVRPLTVILQIRLEYPDGSTETIGTDSRWKVAPGPVTFANVYGGEDCDRGLEPAGWNRPGFDDSHWAPPSVTKGPGGELRGLSRSGLPIRAFGSRPAQLASSIAPGVDVYDLGQNAAYVLRLRTHGPRGATVAITGAELLRPDGNIDTRSSSHGAPPPRWTYTLAGDERDETWAPDLFYLGCRYLLVERRGPPSAAADLPFVDGLEGAAVHADAEPVGEFACSNTLFNRIHTLIRWAQSSNMMSVLTDCPHRERLGWLEQTHLNGPALRYEFGLDPLFAKACGDMADAQLPSGLVPDIAPEFVVFAGGFRDSPEWGSARVIVPWQQHEWTGEVGLLKDSYDGMKRYVSYLGSRADSCGIVDYGLGDWFDIGPGKPGYAQLTPPALTATAFYFLDTQILARTAALLGKPAEAAEFDARAGRIRDAFNRVFFDAAAGSYSTGSQCSNALALSLGLVPVGQKERVFAALVAQVERDGEGITAGDVGYRFLLLALADGGRSDLIYRIANRSDRPGYGFQLARGATSLTEAWDANPIASQNHFMLGQINEWFYRYLAGIAVDPDGPGFRKIILRPAVVGDLSWVRASYDSPMGIIRSQWSRNGDSLEIRATIPPGATATVFVPGGEVAPVFEGGRPAGAFEGVRFLRREAGASVFEVQSGTYVFSSTLAARAVR